MMHSSQRSSTFAGGGRGSPSRGPTIVKSDTVFIRTEIASHPSAAIDAEFVSPGPFVSSPFSASLHSESSALFKAARLPMVCWENGRTANGLLTRASVPDRGARGGRIENTGILAIWSAPAGR
jgi:hypothetical protein